MCSAWAPLWATGYVNACNRKRGYGRDSPGVELDGEVAQRRRRRAPAAACATEIGGESLQGFTRRLDPSVRRGMALRSGTVGQGCSGLAGGVQKGRRKTYPRRGGALLRLREHGRRGLGFWGGGGVELRTQGPGWGLIKGGTGYLGVRTR